MEREICLDSDIIIDLLCNDAETVARLSTAGSNYSTTTINIFEIWSGRKAGEASSSLVSWMNILPFDKRAALIAGDIRRSLRKKGADIEIRDVFIASICISGSIPLLTKNSRHFERMKEFGLVLV